MARRSQDNTEMDEDLFAERPAPAAAAPKAKPSKEETAAKRAAKADAERKQMNRNVRGRQRWEKSPEGQARMANAQQALGTRATLAQIYLGRQWGEAPQHETGHPQHYDRQLPGLEDPHAAPQNKRWEEHTPQERAEIQHRVKLRTGATLESMTHSFGAQLDQAYLHAEEGPRHPSGEVRPPGQDFYTSGEPKQVIRKTAVEHGVPTGLVAAMHADNSPNTSFKRTGPEGESVYPQDVMTRAALTHVQEGRGLADPHNVERPPHSEGYQTNLIKASRRAHQVLHEGKPVPETTVGGGGGHGLGPKTSAYMNSWLTSTPDFFVADVHSGGGGLLPHLGSEKRARLDAEGQPLRKTVGRSASPTGSYEGILREKSEREKGIETTGFHAMADYAARQAMVKRGLGSLRQAQAAQWAEERHQRGFKPAHDIHGAEPGGDIHTSQGRLF